MERPAARTFQGLGMRRAEVSAAAYLILAADLTILVPDF